MKKTYVTRTAIVDHGFKPMHRFVEGHTDGDGFRTETITTQNGNAYIVCSLEKINTQWWIEIFPSGDYIITEKPLTEEPPADVFDALEETTFTETPDSKAFHSVTPASKPTDQSTLESLLAASVALNKKAKK